MHGNSIHGTTPFPLCQQMVEKTVAPNHTVLDLACGKGSFLLAAIRHLIVSGVSVKEAVDSVYGVDSSQSQIDHTRTNIKRATGYVPRLECANSLTWETDLKFDAVVGNPPYQGTKQLHQQFFNRAIDMLVDGGSIAFVQPATVYLNKKPNAGKHTQLMRDNINQYVTDVSLISPKVFENARINTKLAVTVLRKTTNSSGLVKSVTYRDIATYNDLLIDNINYMEMEPLVYASLYEKYTRYIAVNGSLQDITYSETDVPITLIASLSKIRSRIEARDFYTFISDNSDYWAKNVEVATDFGIPVTDNTQLANVYSYLQTYIARFGLAILKTNLNHHRGEFAKVPLVDFDHTYTDKQLCAMIGITPTEYAAILKVIVPYHHRLLIGK
jgi:cyclopropane fatty-acyl-phospholipid synthase-like methyltransferase